MCKKIALLFVIFLMPAIVFAVPNRTQNIKTPFDVNEVIQKVSQTREEKASSRMNIEHKRKPNFERFHRQMENGKRLPDTNEFLINRSIVYRPAPDYQWSAAVAFDGTNYLVVWVTEGSEGGGSIYCTRVDRLGVVLDPAGIYISNSASYFERPSVAFDGTNFFVVWTTSWGWVYGARVSQDGVILDPTEIVISNSGLWQDAPSIAFDGTNFLAVWNDYRNGNWDIYGVRINQSGIVLGTGDIPISVSIDDQYYPSLAYDGNNYLVAWEDGRSGGYSYADIYGTFVSKAGNVLDTVGIPISTATNGQREPSIAFDGINYLVVWADARFGSFPSDIYGSRVDTAGVVVDPDGIAISTAINEQRRPSVAFDDTNYMIVWEDRRSGINSPDIYGSRLNTAGTVLDPAGIAIATELKREWGSFVVFDGTNFLVTWTNGDIYGVRVSQAGVIIDSSSIPISTAANWQGSSSIAFDGSNYLVVWEDSRSDASDVYGARVTQTGVVLDLDGIPVSTAENDQEFPSVSFDGINYFIVWQDYRNNRDTSDIYGARVDQSGNVLDTAGIPISNVPYSQKYPSIVFDSTNYLVVWEDYRGGTNSDIYGCRVDVNGICMDGEAGFAISTATGNQISPRLAFDGTNYLVVWEDSRSQNYREIYGCRVSTSATLMDSNGIAISTAVGDQENPAIAFGKTNYLVVWESHISYTKIYGARVNRTGAILDPKGFAISTKEGYAESPAVIFDNSDYLVAWTLSWSNGGMGMDIYGALVDNAGIAVGNFPISVKSEDQFSPTLSKGSSHQVLITFSGWVHSDQGRTYNTYRILGIIDSFYPPPWVQLDTVPTQVSGKYVKDGGALTAVSGAKDGDLLFAFRGFKSKEFYMYDIGSGWTSKNTIPYGYKYPLTTPPAINKKTPGKGAALCYDGDNIIYAIKGNGTYEFWAYDVSANTWTAKAFVPSVQKLKGGTSMAYYDGKVYLLAGAQKKDNTHNFFAYDPIQDTWITLTGAPLAPPATGKAKPFKDGSCISIIGNTIYVLKGGDKYNFLYAYDIAGDTALGTPWTEMESIPLIHPALGKKNKVGDGGAMTTDGAILYAIKGKGKQDFWSYSPISKSVWTPLDTIPRVGEAFKKSVPKTGAGLAYANGAVYLLKGNKTPEFWRYTPIEEVQSKTISNIMVEQIKSFYPFMLYQNLPNPFKSQTAIRYSLPVEGKVSLAIYDVSGRLVKNLVDEFKSSGVYSVKWNGKDEQNRAVAEGIYFYTLETQKQKFTKKLILTR